MVGTAVVLDGDYLVALAPRSDTHAGQLARFLLADLLAGAMAPEWWAGGASGWVAEPDLVGPPAIVIDDAGSEASLHREPTPAAWVHVASRGFGKTTIASAELQRSPAFGPLRLTPSRLPNRAARSPLSTRQRPTPS